MYSLACTDALQLIFIMLGLAISAPYIIFHPAVSLERNLARQDWLGEVRNDDLGLWVDGALLLIFGGIPWQVTYIKFLISKFKVQLFSNRSIFLVKKIKQKPL